MINQQTATQTNNTNAFQLSHDALSSFNLNSNADIPKYAFSFTQPKKVRKNFHVIGNECVVKFGAWYCEGELGLAIYDANGDGQITLSNADKLPVVMCDIGQLETVAKANHLQDFEDIQIVADVNDAKSHRNALQAAYHLKIRHYYIFDKVTLAFKKFAIPTDYSEYLLAMIAVEPTKNAMGLMARFMYHVASDIPRKYDIKTAADLIVNAMQVHGIDVRTTAEKIIERAVNKRKTFIQKLNEITDYRGTKVHNCDDLSNDEILELMERETSKAFWGMKMCFVDTRKKGAGKTNLMALRMKNLSSCGYISHRVSLINDACKRLGLANYQDGDMHADKIAVCINSIKKFFSSLYGKPLFIDEARQLFETVLHATTIDGRNELFDLFCELLEAAPMVHLADANMNDEALDFYKQHCGNKLVQVIKTTPEKNTVNHWQLENFEAAYTSILRDMNAGLKGTVACTCEAEAQKLRRFLIQNGFRKKRIAVVTGGAKDNDILKLLSNVNHFGKNYDVIIYTSAMGTGVSIEMPEFEFAYLLCSNILTSNESLQMLARNRCAKDYYVAFDKPFSTKRVTDEELLREGQIQKVINFAADTGMQFNSDFRGTIVFLELDDRLHRTKAKMNQDLNDFANNLLLLAELEGRYFVKIHEEKADTKHLAKEVKEEEAQEIQVAPAIVEQEYSQLKKSNVITKEQAASVKRHEVCKMVGMLNTATLPLEMEDIQNYQKGYTSIVVNYELLTASPKKLKEWDLLNYHHRNKQTCLLSRQKIFKAVLKPLIKAQKGEGITKPDLMKALAVLEQHAPELAAEFSDYSNLNPVRVAAIIRNFVKKFGYKLENVGRKSTGQRHRIYEIKVMPEIERYAANRKALKG